MKTYPPKYSDLQLQLILDSDPQLPKNISERDFVNDIQNNARIKWRVNHFLFRKKFLPYLLDDVTFKKWRIFKSLNWIMAFFIIGFSIWMKDYRILLFLIVYPFLIATVDHWIFIFNMTLVVGIKLLFKLNIAYFWVFAIFILIGYLLNKAIDEMIERKILKQALKDWIIFWKYHSNKIIWMDKSALNNEYQRLTDKYPELQD